MREEKPRLAEEGFQSDSRELEKRVLSYSGREREKNTCLYFEFDSPQIRDAAMKFLYNLREERKDFDEKFLYFVGISIDRMRLNEGIEIRFSKNAEQLRQQFWDLLASQGFVPKETY